MTRGCLSDTHYTPGVVGAPSDMIAGKSTTTNSYLLKNGVAIRVSKEGTCQQDTTLQKKGCSESVDTCTPSEARYSYGTYKHGCIKILVDINGPAGPNKTDIDAFNFVVVQNGIVPLGSAKEPLGVHSFAKSCANFNKYYNGHCAAWVIYNKNMDYLKCPDKLGWDKASSCK